MPLFSPALPPLSFGVGVLAESWTTFMAGLPIPVMRYRENLVFKTSQAR